MERASGQLQLSQQALGQKCVSSYEEQLVLPCADPAVQGQQLVLTMQVFSSCACCRRRCGD